MKVCFVTDMYPPSSQGGIGEVVHSLQEYFTQQGVTAYVFSSGIPEENFPNIIRTPGNTRLFFPLSPIYYLKKIRKIQFDIINLHMESGIFLTPFLFRNKKTKTVTTLHTEYLTESQTIRNLKHNDAVIDKPSTNELLTKYFLTSIKVAGTRLDMTVSNQIVAVSNATRACYTRQHGIPEEKIAVIYNGVDTHKFNPEISKYTIREKYSVGSSPLILVIGSGRILKGAIFAIYAMKQVLNECPDAKLVVTGIDQKSKQRFLNAIKSLALQENVLLLDHVPNNQLPSYYSSSDIVVIPSLQENFPMVALEAMSSGKPVVASRIGGIPELIENNVNGILTNPSDTDQMSEAIIRLLQEPQTRIKMGERGRRLIQEKYDWKKTGKKYLRLFEKLI